MTDLFAKYPEMMALQKAVEARQRELQQPGDYQRLFARPSFRPDGGQPEEHKAVVTGGSAASCETLAAKPPVQKAAAAAGPSLPDQAKIIPAIGLAAAAGNHGGAWRLWVLAKACNPSGSGSLPAGDLAALASTAGIHPRSYARWLSDAVKLGWIRRSKDHKILYLAGPAALARKLNLSYVGNTWVMVGLRGLLRDGWQGMLWAAALTLFPRNVSRETLRQVTGVPERTQRYYEGLSGVGHERSYAVSNLPGQDQNFVDGYRETKRKSAFRYVDRKTGKAFIAWRLPDKRQVPAYVAVPTGSRGRLSKINSRLAVASSSLTASSGIDSAAGRGGQASLTAGRALGESTGRLFYDGHQAAEKGAKRIKRRLAKQYSTQAQVAEVYYPRPKGRKCQTYGVVFL